MPKKSNKRNENQVKREVRRRTEAERKKKLYEPQPEGTEGNERMLHEIKRLNESARWLEEHGISRRAIIDVTETDAYITLMFDIKKWGMTPEPEFHLFYKEMEGIHIEPRQEKRPSLPKINPQPFIPPKSNMKKPPVVFFFNEWGLLQAYRVQG
jgi:hypothetical protein